MHASHFTTLLAFALGVSATPTPPSPPRSCYLPKRLIALEEHVVSPSLEAEVIASGVVQRSAPGILEKLKDVGTGRVAAMDAGKLSLQVLAQQSASGLEDAEGCRKANDAVRAAIAANPKRFAGFAVIPMASPDEAAAELQRTVTQLGFKGAMIWNHLKDGTYYDAARFDPVFAMAQKLGVPIYLHPAAPTADNHSRSHGNKFVGLARRCRNARPASVQCRTVRSFPQAENHYRAQWRRFAHVHRSHRFYGFEKRYDV
jgi:predicted TIM-barrel fold metal-dependent hydrolase